MTHPWDAENEHERARLEALVARLSDEELQTPMPAGWTVAGVLAHCVFWDARVLYYLDKWERGGSDPNPAEREAENVDWINDGVKPIALALPPRIAADLAVSTAREVDARVGALSDELIEKIESVGGIISLNRGNHRREHLDEIEAALARSA